MSENLTVRTPLGEIKAVKSQDENYPGIHFYVDGKLAGYLEAELSQGEIRFVQWERDSDEPNIHAVEGSEEDREQMNIFDMGVCV